MPLLLKCPVCKKYTLKQKCHCATQNPHPPKFNPRDKWGEYRRMAKKI
ncbi:MAG: nucleolar RNA-binding Nop10p family protein [Candidatus Micrarchaeia archaeon]